MAARLQQEKKRLELEKVSNEVQQMKQHLQQMLSLVDSKLHGKARQAFVRDLAERAGRTNGISGLSLIGSLENEPALTLPGREGSAEAIVGEKRTATKAGLEDGLVAILKKLIKCD